MCRKCKGCGFFVFRPGGPAGYTKRCLLKKANNPEITGWVTNGNDGFVPNYVFVRSFPVNEVF